VIGSFIGWWLARQGLTVKPWLETGVIGDSRGSDQSAACAAKTGLLLFLGVAGCLFALFVSAYLIRMGTTDWWPMPLPSILWVNTALLVASSLALQFGKISADRGHVDAIRASLAAGALSALAFLAGQLLAWRELIEAGYGLTGSPANSFFYLISAVHGLHVAGGMVALARVLARAWQEPTSARLHLGIELCATYWHFMLGVWLVLFALLAGWADDVAAICRQVLG
jgi:cytochrome c oxidase subunit III